MRERRAWAAAVAAMLTVFATLIAVALPPVTTPLHSPAYAHAPHAGRPAVRRLLAP